MNFLWICQLPLSLRVACSRLKLTLFFLFLSISFLCRPTGVILHLTHSNTHPDQCPRAFLLSLSFLNITYPSRVNSHLPSTLCNASFKAIASRYPLSTCNSNLILYAILTRIRDYFSLLNSSFPAWSTFPVLSLYTAFSSLKIIRMFTYSRPTSPWLALW